MHDIGIWFLLLSLFLPRFTLFFWWISGNLPYHETSTFVNVITSILIPRILILVWIYTAMGMCAWFWIHFVALIITWTHGFIKINSWVNNHEES